MRYVELAHLANGVGPTHGLCSLPRQGIRDTDRLRFDRHNDVVDQINAWLLYDDLLEPLSQPLARGLKQRRVKASRHRQRHGTLGAQPLSDLAGALDRTAMPCDDNL